MLFRSETNGGDVDASFVAEAAVATKLSGRGRGGGPKLSGRHDDVRLDERVTSEEGTLKCVSDERKSP